MLAGGGTSTATPTAQLGSTQRAEGRWSTNDQGAGGERRTIRTEPPLRTREKHDQRTTHPQRSGWPSSASATVPRRSCRAFQYYRDADRRPGPGLMHVDFAAPRIPYVRRGVRTSRAEGRRGLAERSPPARTTPQIADVTPRTCRCSVGTPSTGGALYVTKHRVGRRAGRRRKGDARQQRRSARSYLRWAARRPTASTPSRDGAGVAFVNALRCHRVGSVWAGEFRRRCDDRRTTSRARSARPSQRVLARVRGKRIAARRTMRQSGGNMDVLN